MARGFSPGQPRRGGLARAGRIARRSLLIGSVAVAGGVAFGAWRYTRPLPDPFADDAETVALTPYVVIDAEGITLIAPRADKGQGSRWVQAALIAEELDIDPASARIEAGPVSPAYYNRALLAENLPFLPTDQGWLARNARAASDIPARLLGLQMTGGSSTVPDGFRKLREAGAVARETLKEAAALREGLDRTALGTEDGHVVLPDGRRIPYADLAVEAARIEPVTTIVLRDPAQWRHLGKPMQRGDIVAKSTGTQEFGIDLRLPDMLFATVRAAPEGGQARLIDDGAARAFPGVHSVTAISGGVAVLAQTTWHAFRAADALVLELTGPTDRPADSAAIWDALSRSFEERGHDSRNRNDGDVEAALAAGDGVIEAEYRVPFLAHAPMEPLNATVLVTDSACHIWAGTQIPDFVVTHAARLTGLPQTAIRLENPMIGGSFGRRLELDFILQAIEVAQSVPGRPVKMTWTREEDFAQSRPRPAQIARARGRVGETGIEALDLTIASPSVMSSWFGRVWMNPPGPDISIVAGAWDQPFAIPHFRVTGKRAPDLAPVSSWRSVGASSTGFYLGSFMDEMFESAGIDPFDGLLRACNDDVSRTVIDEARRLCDWRGRQPGPGRGRGVAFCLSFGVPCAEVVEVEDTPQGLRITEAWAVADIGTVLDPVNAEAQLSGGMLFGLGHAMNCQITYADHRPEQQNFYDHDGMRLPQCPRVTTRLLENGPVRGLGEPGLPPAAAALANAIRAATGQRVRQMPFADRIRFA
ncbi:xanthine dehydrogenase family protein molybdopterin-binding subunit [Paracoccus sp. (in: a-proteobacteria)]|uniref:xanthine dehydrogenase family protein molybdopterin-binding subunit n=1 Tax=Paracoccus sp. TaxID=267 RepID=UPI00272D0769|nr:molybdopterin cofactor-binding domain-containing protein [Paracoccus sp. (in: a-proteobacteria)]